MGATSDAMLTLTHATERDVDLLLIEELKCSTPFVHWFVDHIAHKLGRPWTWSNSIVTHSRRRLNTRREIDITLELHGDKTTVFLIENKLDTEPQVMQAESYQQEAEALVSHGNAFEVITILIAPAAYLTTKGLFAEKFDAIIPYETIIAHLAQRAGDETGELAQRLKHREALLRQAVTKARRGYEAVPVAAIGSFNTRYVALLRTVDDTLEPGPAMLKEWPPGESKTMIFAPAALPKWNFLPQTRLVHQLREGNANINFYGWGDHFTHLAQIMANDLFDTPYRLVPTVNKRVGGKSGLMIVVDTPPIDNLSSFDSQEDGIVEGIRRTVALRSWFLSNQAVIERWCKAAAALSQNKVPS